MFAVFAAMWSLGLYSRTRESRELTCGFLYSFAIHCGYNYFLVYVYAASPGYDLVECYLIHSLTL